MTKPLPSCFVIAPGATRVSRTEFQGKDQLTYRVEASYPARNILKLVTGRLRTLGWVGLKEYWLNPGLPSSLIRGWDYFEDQTTRPATSVRAWQADWENRRHDILVYILEYRCPDKLCASTAEIHDLRVTAIHVPADLAKQIKSSVSDANQKHR